MDSALPTCGEVTSWRNFAAMPTTDTELLNVQQAAERLTLSPRAVLHRITTGRIQATKVGSGRTSSYVITAAEVARVKAEDAA